MEESSGENLEDLQLYPPWKEALKKFAAAGFKEGDIVTYEWLYEAFEIEMPGPTTPLAEAEKSQLAFLGNFKAMQARLLTENQIDLTNERGQGYLVVPPADQTTLAYTDGVAEIKKGLRKMTTRIIHVDASKLTGPQRKENADALAKLGTLKAMMKAAKDFPRITSEE